MRHETFAARSADFSGAADSRRVSLPLPEPGAGARACLDSRTLLNGAREVIIRHGDQEYRLRHTQNDKLILTK
jgi:hemin uptake protein HemP